VRGGLNTITVPTPFSVGPVNCYLLEGDPLTLIDVGPNNEAALEALEAGLSAHGTRVEDLELILLTHQHYDHIGLASALAERSGATIAAHELLARFLADFDASMDAEDDYAAAIMTLHGVEPETAAILQEQSRTYRGYGTTTEVGQILREGDSVTAGGRELTVALRPGHSPTDTIFIDTDSWSAFVGDHLIEHISSNPIVHRPPAGDADPRQRRRTLLRYLESLEETGKLDLELLHSGHGEPIKRYKDLVYDRQVHHDERKEYIFEQLAGRPRTARELTRLVWPVLATDQVYLAISEVLGHVDLLLEEERVVEEEADGVVTIRALA
jgi:glyoxylase-like metal-dependent hydrolase (beta-lactamase superfamily II)